MFPGAIFFVALLSLPLAQADVEAATMTLRFYDASGNMSMFNLASGYYSPDTPIATATGLPIRYIDQSTLSATPGCPITARTAVGPAFPRRLSWVGLSFRCGFSFSDRSIAAYLVGAGAVIIAEPTADPVTSPAVGNGAIASISVGNTTGRVIYDLMASCGSAFGASDLVCNAYIDIRPGISGTSSSTLVPQAFAFGLVMFFLAMCCCVFVRRNSICACFCRTSRNFDPLGAPDDPMLLRMLQIQQHASQEQLQTVASAVAALPVEELSQARAAELCARQDACAVCLDGFEANTLMRTLACEHVYHKDCIDPWLTDHGTCPLCKARIVLSAGQDDNAQAPLTEQQLYMLLLHLHMRRRSRAPPEAADYLQALASMTRPDGPVPHIAPPWPHEETAFRLAASPDAAAAAGPAANPAYASHGLADDQLSLDSMDSIDASHAAPAPTPAPGPGPAPVLNSTVIDMSNGAAAMPVAVSAAPSRIATAGGEVRVSVDRGAVSESDG